MILKIDNHLDYKKTCSIRYLFNVALKRLALFEWAFILNGKRS
jgi:hypothetical protein